MAVHIRLRRGGKKKQPFYRIVAADARSPRDGRFLEILGHYNPIPETEEVVVKQDRLIYWLKEGARPSDTVKSLLKRKGVWKEVMAEIDSTMKTHIKKSETQPEGALVKDVAETPVEEV